MTGIVFILTMEGNEIHIITSKIHAHVQFGDRNWTQVSKCRGNTFYNSFYTGAYISCK